MNASCMKSYLVRAIYEWCIDNEFTPYVTVVPEAHSTIPSHFIQDGEVTLNISSQATSDLVIDNERILFSARFSGVPIKIEISIGSLKAIFAKEIGQGLTFVPETDVVDANVDEKSEQTPIVNEPSIVDNALPHTPAKRGKPSLKIVK